MALGAKPASTMSLMAPLVAYLDGGTISLFVAAVAGAVAGAGVYARSAWHRLVRKVRRIRTRKDLDPEIS